ncbi:molybdopterin converting factor subunit 1 [Mucilaginibacter sp. Bleaf8]|uniref:molybdopterin converting factor subunit 1 n=1 Tax=Mucilaginibacter sp. Bleaf8 TaxID=2834430 RepID=UPI001BCF495C|nr:molybdopterin converting factor subunit 1 [Mucilaginibacter sp. Bleaf8]MBS7566229.1 molybdopterin converting factor subunit 1 [Mucilaginibacter sp. Bleaf8]
MEILLFGITREIVGKQKLPVPADQNITTVKALKTWLGQQYPAMQSLSSLLVAVDSEYAQDDDVLNGENEIALIPPVSGG